MKTTVILQVGDFVQCYNGTQGKVIDRHVNYTVDLEYAGVVTNIHKMNIKTVNNRKVFAEDIIF